MRAISLISVCIAAIVTSTSCKKEPTPVSEELSVLGYSNLRWEGGDNHYWSVYTINSDGTSDQKLVSSDMQLCGTEWSPDGTKILVCGMATPTLASPRLLYVMNADGTNLQNLTQLTDAVSPRWSRDGLKITFTKCYPEQNNRSEIWMMNADGSEQISIVEGHGSSFFANGTKLIYISAKTGNSEIYTCDIDGTNQLKITSTAESEYNMDVSPDGTMVIYTLIANSTDINTWEIYCMNMDGTNVTRLTNNSYLDEQARWSPDGNRIAFISSRGNSSQRSEVYIMNADGTGAKKVTNANSRSNSANLPSWKPK